MRCLAMSYKVKFIFDENSVVTVWVDGVIRSTHSFHNIRLLKMCLDKLNAEGGRDITND